MSPKHPQYPSLSDSPWHYMDVDVEGNPQQPTPWEADPLGIERRWWTEVSIREILAGLPAWTGGPLVVRLVDRVLL